MNAPSSTIHRFRAFRVLPMFAAPLLAACVATTGPARPPAPYPGPVTHWRCGAYPVETRALGSDIELRFNGRSHRLYPTPAGSGARYEGRDSAGQPIVFWDKAGVASLQIGGWVHPTCRHEPVAARPQPPAPLPPVGTVPPMGAPSLIGGEWRIERLNGQAPALASQPHVAFHPDGRVTGHSGCNRFMGRFTQDAGGLRLSALAGTRMACPDPLMKQEDQLLQLLSAVSQPLFDASGALILRTPDGRTLSARRP